MEPVEIKVQHTHTHTRTHRCAHSLKLRESGNYGLKGVAENEENFLRPVNDLQRREEWNHSTLPARKSATFDSDRVRPTWKAAGVSGESQRTRSHHV